MKKVLFFLGSLYLLLMAVLLPTPASGQGLRPEQFIALPWVWPALQTFTVLETKNVQSSAVAYSLQASNCGKDLIFTANTPIVVTIPAAIVPIAGTSCWITVHQSGSAKVHVDGSAVTPATLVSSLSYNGTNGTAGSMIWLELTTIAGTPTATLFGDGSVSGTSYVLSLTSANGVVTSSPSGISCGATCSASFPSGTVITLTAIPSAGYVLSGWSGGGCSGTGTCIVTLTGATSVTASYTLSGPTVEVAGPSAALFASPFYTCTRNYYVATTGNDSNAGTSGSPWLTIQHADTASGGRAAGDCVNVVAGTYTVGSVITNGGNAATASGYVVYRCTTLDACIITENDHGFKTDTTAFPDYLVFDGFELAASSEVAYGQGILVSDGISPENTFGSHHIWVLNNLIHGYGQSGVQMNDGEYFYVMHNTIYNNSNVTCDAQGSGISHAVPKAVSGYTPTAMDLQWNYKIIDMFNYLYNNILTACGSAPNPYDTDGNGIILDTWDGGGTTFGPYAGSGVVAFNVTVLNGGKGVQVVLNTDATILIANNTSYDNNLDPYNNATARGEINIAGSQHTTVENNIVYPVPGSGYLVSNSAYLAGAQGADPVGVTFTTNLGFGGTPIYGGDGHGNALFSGATINCSTGANPNKCNVNPNLVNVSTPNYALCTGVGTPSGCPGASPVIGYGGALSGVYSLVNGTYSQGTQALDGGANYHTTTHFP